MKKTRGDRRFWTRAVALATFAAAWCAPSEAARPNVLLVMPDQMRGQATGFAGDPNAKTPRLDRLASEGLFLSNMIANAPVCCPARATILTGKYPARHGLIANDLRLRESEATLAEILAAEGYRTGFVGKWHLDGGPRQPGFVPPGPRRQGFEFWAAHECSHEHFANHFFRNGPQAEKMRDYESREWTNLALEFLDAEDDRPFFLFLTMGPPHDPYRAPEPYASMHDPAKLETRPNWDGKVVPREHLAQYYAMISDLDEQVGRVLDRLEEKGLAENTIVWFTSDHGDMLGSQGMRLKRKPWEESIVVPGIVRWPAGIPGGRRSEAVVSHVDLLPTLLAMCGAPVPPDAQGTDVSRALRGEDPGPDAAFLMHHGPYAPSNVPAGWRGIRTRTHTYARFRDEPWVLYDNAKDPYQTENLARSDEPEIVALRSGLDARLKDWMEETGETWDADYEIPIEEGGRLYREKTYYSVEEFLADRPEEASR